LDPEQAILFVIDGGKALRRAIKDVFGERSRTSSVSERSCTAVIVTRNVMKQGRRQRRSKASATSASARSDEMQQFVHDSSFSVRDTQ
jgi:hypothetical protein